MFEKFETIHPSQTAAFADGMLCGIVVAVIGFSIYKSFRNEKTQRELMMEVQIEDTVVPIRKVEL